MKTKIVVALAFTMLSGIAWSYDYDLADDEYGNSRIATFEGYMFSKWKPIVLLPAAEAGDGVAAHADYSMLFRIVYKDDLLPRPNNDDDWKQAGLTAEMLHGWLEAYVQAECAEADVDLLCSGCLNHSFVRNLQDTFPDYVRTRIAQMKGNPDIRVEIVTVEVYAEGAFRAELDRRLAAVGR